MGLSFRKSIKAGPFRLNFSKKGVGISAGIKGLRIGSGPNGNYISMGIGGITYRKSISSSSNKPRNISDVPLNEVPNSSAHSADYYNFKEIESADIGSLMDSSSAELLGEFDKKRKMIVFWPLYVAAGLAGLYVFKDQSSSIIIAWLMIATAVSYIASITDRNRKNVTLFYDLDAICSDAYTNLLNSFSDLQKIHKKWHVESQADVRDRKRNAGASQVISRKDIILSIKKHRYIKTNINLPSFPVGRQELYFFPDRILVFERNAVGAVSYSDLNISLKPSRFIETGSLPHDAEVVDYTWKYVNKSGGPDKRFNDNKRYSICLYDDMHLTSSTGLNELVSFSKCGICEKFVRSIQQLSSVMVSTGNRDMPTYKVGYSVSV